MGVIIKTRQLIRYSRRWLSIVLMRVELTFLYPNNAWKPPYRGRCWWPFHLELARCSWTLNQSSPQNLSSSVCRIASARSSASRLTNLLRDDISKPKEQTVQTMRQANLAGKLVEYDSHSILVSTFSRMRLKWSVFWKCGSRIQAICKSTRDSV
jgi:hypothetical protein